jgi:hypothetical protein
VTVAISIAVHTFLGWMGSHLGLQGGGRKDNALT